ncbi:uncharacterized protein [Gossypium hirsutum]|uniref:RNase H type-1 domain-containing protein n=1 Tax=Gossypium hirsutum TaxID=3635 RepID=A0A1U8IM48_GOSHI|nr:uncharacterized protein LOC107898219 [Gossypium hirsutum]
MDKKAMSDFIATLWNIWNGRNSKVFRNVEEDAKVIWDKAAALNKDFHIFNLLDRPMIPKPIVERVWQKPEAGFIKINFDATIQESLVFYGLVARDADGFVYGGHVGMIDKVSSIEWAEMYALDESIKYARSKNWKYVSVESDCASIVNRFNSRKEDLTLIGHQVKEIRKHTAGFNFFKANWAPRCCNKVADALCKWAFINKSCMDFNMDFPTEIHDLVLKDAIN